MKKMYLCMLLLIGFQAMVNAQCKIKAPIIVYNIADLNAEIDSMELNSVGVSSTVILANGTYNSSTAAILNRNINISGECPCKIQAQTADGVILKGDVAWKLNNSNNLTIDGFQFLRTTYGNVSGVIDFGPGSHDIILTNSRFLELPDNYSTTAGYYVRMNGGVDNTISNSFFQNKYSGGSYVVLQSSATETISGATISGTHFFEDDYRLDQITGSKRFINLTSVVNSTISGCTFENKYSRGDYLLYTAPSVLTQGIDNVFSGNIMSEIEHEDIIDSSSLYNDRRSYIKYTHEKNFKIIDNEFSNKYSPHHMIDFSPPSDVVNVGGEISHNIFGKKYQLIASSMIKLGNCGGTTIGSGEMNILVDNNTFKEYNYNKFPYFEIISNKSSKNTFSNNKFLGCIGNLRVRCGNEVTINNNKFVGSNGGGYQGGVALSGIDHKIYNNHFENLNFYVLDLYGGNTDTSNYVRVENLDFAFNTIVNCIPLIYFRKSATHYYEMPLNCRIENNIFANLSLPNSIRYVVMDNEYDSTVGSLDETDFSTNHFNANVFYSISTDNDITVGWTLPTTPTAPNSDLNPNLSYDITNEIYKLTAASLNSLNSSYVDPLDVTHYSYVTHDILGTLRGANKDIGCHEYDYVSRATSNTVALFENTNTKLQSYPNPVNDIITLTGVLDESSYVIYNINGVKVQEGSLSNNQQINVEKLSRGMYFLTVNNAETIKLIKN